MSDDALVSVRFLVQAGADPGLLPRLLMPLAKRDLTPDRLHAAREGEVMRAELVLLAMPAGMVHLVAGNLGQVVGVLSVRLERDGEERPAAAAPLRAAA
jgi:hypothetical protein